MISVKPRVTRGRCCTPPIFDVLIDHPDEFLRDRRTGQHTIPFAVDENRRARAFSATRQRDADIGGTRFPGAVDDAAHYRHLQGFRPGILRLPIRKIDINLILDIASELSEQSRSSATASGARSDGRAERADSQGLQYVLTQLDFVCPISADFWREARTDGVADAVVKQH